MITYLFLQLVGMSSENVYPHSYHFQYKQFAIPNDFCMIKYSAVVTHFRVVIYMYLIIDIYLQFEHIWHQNVERYQISKTHLSVPLLQACSVAYNNNIQQYQMISDVYVNMHSFTSPAFGCRATVCRHLHEGHLGIVCVHSFCNFQSFKIIQCSNKLIN